MGRNDYAQGWQQDKGGRGSRWQRKGKGDGKEKPNQTRFPRYDAKKVEPKEATPQKDTLALETSAPSDGSLVSTFQAHINAVRKAEARVQSLTQLRKQRTTQWDTYEANLQKSYMQEKERYQRAIQKLDSDLLEAEATQERMSTVLRQAHAASALSGRGTDADMPSSDPDWERLTQPIADTAESDAEALMRILGRDVRQWGTKLAAMEGAGPPPGLAMGAMGPENVTAPAVDSTNVGVATAPVPTGTAQAAPTGHAGTWGCDDGISQCSPTAEYSTDLCQGPYSTPVWQARQAHVAQQAGCSALSHDRGRQGTATRRPGSTPQSELGLGRGRRRGPHRSCRRSRGTFCYVVTLGQRSGHRGPPDGCSHCLGRAGLSELLRGICAGSVYVDPDNPRPLRSHCLWIV